MIDLLPAERWEYGFKDVVDGMAAILGGTTSPESLYIPGLGESVPTRSARAGIVAAIGALRIRRGATIGVPLYCCPVVFKAVVAAGCKVRFIDVETSSYCLSADDLSAKIDQMDAVIAVHMFGNPCDMDKIKKAAAGRPIIEDCAQALGSMLGGRHVGSLGEISVFSFRSGKYLSVGEGGALYSEDCSIHSRLAEIVNSTAVPPPLEQYLHVAKTYMRTLLRRKPFYGLLGHALWQSYNKHAEYSTKSPLVVSRIFCADLAISPKKYTYFLLLLPIETALLS